MELSLRSIAMAAVFVLAVTWAWRALNWLWLRPKRLEKFLRGQGLSGNSYKLLFGDMKEMSSLSRRALSAPIDLTDDIIPRSSLIIHHSVEAYGRNSFVWIGPTPRVLITKPEQIRDVLTNLEAFQKEITVPIVKLLANGFASYNGPKWAKHRKLSSHAFRVEQLKNMMPVFCLSSREMIDDWEKLVPDEGSFVLDVQPSLDRLMSDVISRTAFGSSYEEGRRIFQLQKGQAAIATKAMRSIYIPGSRFIPDKLSKRMKEIDVEVRTLLEGMIRERRRAMRSGSRTYDDLLSILVEEGFGLSTEEVIRDCKLFYFAGKETTANILVWTMVMLGKHTDWQRQAREEVWRVFGKAEPGFDGLSRLKIVTMIMNEVLRLYPPAGDLVRHVKKNVELSGGLKLPAGVQVSVPLVLIQRDPAIWGDNPHAFDPERFAGGISNAGNGQQLSYFPFGWGPRICVGQNFAMLEAKMAIALILQKFEFELSPLYEHAPITIITLQPHRGAPIILRRVGQ